jgi:hypothetical protein
MTSQAEMKAAIFNKLKGATFTVDLTAPGAPLQATTDDVQRVFDRLGVTHVTLLADGHSTIENPRLPPNGFKAETDSYEPLTHFLNNIVSVANSCLGSPRYLEALQFYPHAAEMRDKVNSERSLKPDILGPLGPPEEKVSWKDVATFIEVKDESLDAIRQLATYAQSHLAFDRRRSFSIAITFHHKNLTLRFYCFHRSGLSMSPQLHLDKEGEFRSVVEHIVGIISIKDEAAFGLDLTRVKDVYRLNDRNYDIVHTIHSRPSIRGHSTVVYVLKRKESLFWLAHTRLTPLHVTRSVHTLDTPASLQSRKLELVEVSELPDKMVYKISYQLKGRPSEGTLFSDFRGQFGIVDIVGYHICSQEEFFGSTERHFSNAKFLPLSSDKTEDTGENRTLSPRSDTYIAPRWHLKVYHY